MNTVDSNLSATAGEQYRTMRAQLWAAVEDEISMNDCDIYRYVQHFCRFTALCKNEHRMWRSGPSVHVSSAKVSSVFLQNFVMGSEQKALCHISFLSVVVHCTLHFMWCTGHTQISQKGLSLRRQE